jgi:hypothetical protein
MMMPAERGEAFAAHGHRASDRFAERAHQRRVPGADLNGREALARVGEVPAIVDAGGGWELEDEGPLRRIALADAPVIGRARERPADQPPGRGRARVHSAHVHAAGRRRLSRELPASARPSGKEEDGADCPGERHPPILQHKSPLRNAGLLSRSSILEAAAP